MVKSRPNPSLSVLCQKLLWVGVAGFGGPLVTLSMMKQAFVDDLGWMSEREYLERMGICKLLPGPVSSLMSLILGRKFFGFWGSVFGLLSYLLPSFLIIVAWVLGENFFVSHIEAGFSDALLWTFKLYIVAAILVASLKLLLDSWKTLEMSLKFKTLLFGSIMLVSLMGAMLKWMELEVLGAALVTGMILYKIFPDIFSLKPKLYSFTVLGIFGLFFVASVVVFGTGYMLFPYLDHELVAKGLLSPENFQAGILLGNLSPGPVVIASTYYGWQLGGFWGAIAATVGVFGGPFILINSIYGLLEKLRARPIMHHLSLCVVPAVVVILLHFNFGFFSQVPLTFASCGVLLACSAVLFYRAPLLAQLVALIFFATLKRYLF